MGCRGRSVDVDLGYLAMPPPEPLYYGTVERFLTTKAGIPWSPVVEANGWELMMRFTNPASTTRRGREGTTSGAGLVARHALAPSAPYSPRLQSPSLVDSSGDRTPVWIAREAALVALVDARA